MLASPVYIGNANESITHPSNISWGCMLAAAQLTQRVTVGWWASPAAG